MKTRFIDKEKLLKKYLTLFNNNIETRKMVYGSKLQVIFNGRTINHVSYNRN